MVIKKTINKEAIKEMPKVLFPGQIHLVQTPWEAEKAVTYLKQYPLLGIDSETRPSFTKGQSHKVALLQVSSEKDCFLFRLNLTGLTASDYFIAGKPIGHQSRALAARRLYDAAQTCSL